MERIEAMEPICDLNVYAKYVYPEGCTKCLLHESRTNIVWASPLDPPPSSKLMIIGEGPGEQEDLQGRPFVGRSGELLHDALAKAFEDTYYGNKIYITNIVKCRPPGNRNPTKGEMETCYPNLQAQYTGMFPELIIVLGKVAAEFILKRPVKITKEHGNLDFINDGFKDVPVLICYHPAYVLRNQKPEIKQGFFQAIRDARRIAYGIPTNRLHEGSSR
jgi:uracil-DNA glycosylase